MRVLPSSSPSLDSLESNLFIAVFNRIHLHSRFHIFASFCNHPPCPMLLTGDATSATTISYKPSMSNVQIVTTESVPSVRTSRSADQDTSTAITYQGRNDLENAISGRKYVTEKHVRWSIVSDSRLKFWFSSFALQWKQGQSSFTDANVALLETRNPISYRSAFSKAVAFTSLVLALGVRLRKSEQ